MMKVLLVLAAVLAVFFLLSLVRVGVALSYAGGGLSARLRLGCIWITLYPRKPPKKARKMKKVKPHKPRKSKEKAPSPPEEGDTLALLWDLIPLMLEAAGRFKQKLCVDRLDLDLVIAAEDPATAAVAYGAANAALGAAIPILENNLHIKEHRFRTRCDFTQTSPSVQFWTAFSLTIGQGTALTAYLGLQALKIFSAHKKDKRKDERKEAA